MVRSILLVTGSLLVFLVSAASANQDCSEAYGGISSKCEIILCPDQYKSFIGYWEGPFETYDEKLGAFRPYHNEITYAESDCLRNLQNGDIFIIGRKIDTYPEFRKAPSKTEKGLLITGRSGGDVKKPFLRSVDDEKSEEERLVNYDLVYQNTPAVLSIWKYFVPAKDQKPEMTFTILDGRDLTEAKTHKRLVTVSLQVGPVTTPYFEGVIVKGYHSKK